jgi:hypothetical protein
MMLAHLSFERQSFGRLIRYLVSDAFRPVATPFRIGTAGFFFDALRVEKVEFTSATTTRNFWVSTLDGTGAVTPIAGFNGIGYAPLRMRIDFNLGIVFESEMERASFGPANVVTLHVREAFFLVFLEVDPRGGPVLHVLPDHLPDLPISDEEKAALRHALTVRNPLAIEGAFGPIRAGGSGRILNAGVAFGADKQIVFRFELDPPPGDMSDRSARLAEWARFFAGQQSSHLGGREWAMHLPTRPMVEAVRQEAAGALSSSKEFQFTMAPSVYWLTNQPALRLDTAGFIPNACGGNDIRVKLWVTVRLSVVTRNVVRINIAMGYGKDAWDVIKCLALATLFWPIVGLVTIVDWKLPWWSFFGYFLVLTHAWVIPMLYIFGRVTGLEETLLAAALEGKVSQANPEGPELHQVGDFAYYVDIPVPLRDPMMRDWVALDEVAGVGDTLIARGALLVPEPVMPRLKGELVRGFERWSLARPCQNAYQRQTTAEVDLSVIGDVSPRPNVALKGTDPAFNGRYWIRYEIMDDERGVYTSQHTRIDYTNVPGRLTVTVTDPPDWTEFKTRPYRLKLRFLTSGGAKLFTIPPPPLWPVPPADPEEARKQEIAIAAWRINTCYWKQNLLTLVRALQVFWLPRPPERELAQHWLVRIGGLAESDAITAWNGETGRRLAQVHSTVGGETEVSLVVPSARAMRTLMLTLNDTPFLTAAEYAAQVARITPLERPGAYSVDSLQTPLVPVARIAFDAEVERLDLVEDRGTLWLTAHSPGGMRRIYAWNGDAAPVLARTDRSDCAPAAVTSRAAGLGQAVGTFDRSAGVFRVRAAGAVASGAVLGEYVERPWFAGGAVAGSTFAQVDDDFRSATIYRRETTVEGGIAAPGWEARGPEDDERGS